VAGAKEQRKVDEFITFAMCAATQAIADAGCSPRPMTKQITTGVMIGSGIAASRALPRPRSS